MRPDMLGEKGVEKNAPSRRTRGPAWRRPHHRSPPPVYLAVLRTLHTHTHGTTAAKGEERRMTFVAACGWGGKWCGDAESSASFWRRKIFKGLLWLLKDILPRLSAMYQAHVIFACLSHCFKYCFVFWHRSWAFRREKGFAELKRGWKWRSVFEN